MNLLKRVIFASFIVVFVHIFSGNSYSLDCNKVIYDLAYGNPSNYGCELTAEQVDSLLGYILSQKDQIPFDAVSRQKRYRYAAILSDYVSRNQKNGLMHSTGVQLSEKEIKRLAVEYRKLEEDSELSHCSNNPDEKRKLKNDIRDLRVSLRGKSTAEIISAYEKSLSLCKTKKDTFSLLLKYRTLSGPNSKREVKKYNKLFIEVLKNDRGSFNYSLSGGSINFQFIPAYYDFFTLVNNHKSADNFNDVDLRAIADAVVNKYEFLHEVWNESSPIFFSNGFDDYRVRKSTRSLLNLTLWAHQKGLEDVVKSVSPLLCKYDYIHPMYVGGTAKFYESISYICSE